MEPISMTSTFIAASRREVKTAAVEKCEVGAAEAGRETGQCLPDDEPNVQGEKW
jgi:hypothetical protein